MKDTRPGSPSPAPPGLGFAICYHHSKEHYLAHFIVIRDSDEQRRKCAVEAARRCIAEQQSVAVDSSEHADVSVVWGAAPNAPVDFHAGPDGWCLLLGEILTGPGPERSSAADYLERISATPSTTFDALHVGIIVSPTSGISIGADLLGIFPVCYAVVGDSLLVASAPALLRCHPSYHQALDPLGLTALLLTNGLIDGVTLYRGVRRLAPGHLLRAPRAGPVREEPQYRFPVTSIHYDQPLLEWSRRLYEALAASCRRHVAPGVPHSLLLSGGLDSRLLAGLLAKQGATITAVTTGRPTDTDYQCARRVARQLGFPHHTVSREGGTWETFRRGLEWNGISSCPGLGSDAVVETVRDLHPRVASGYLMDAIVGGSHMQWCYSHTNHDTGYDIWFTILNSLGVPVETLRRLLRPEVFGDSIDEMLCRIRRRFMENGETYLERSWRFDLAHRQRFVIGGVLVRQMRGAWPVTPHIDRQVLATAGGIPLGAVAGRLLERDIVVRFHHDLARLPLDRGDDTDNSPLDADVRGLLLSLPGRAFRKAAVAMRLPLPERRSFYRTFALEGPGWADVRREWETRREAAYALFVPAVLDAYLPPPGVPWPKGFKLIDTIGRKIIMGATVLNNGA